MLTEPGVAVIEIEPDSGKFTVRPAWTEPLTLPLVPVTVSVNELTEVLDVVATVIVEVAEPLDVSVTEVGLNVADALLGRPLTVNATEPVKPPVDGVW